MSRQPTFLFGALLLVGAVQFVGCSCEEDPDAAPAMRSCDEDNPCKDGLVCVARRCVAADGGGDADLDDAEVNLPDPTAVHLEPEDAVLVALNGNKATVTYQVIGEYPGGETQALGDALFEVDVETFGTIDPDTGVFTANGVNGGEVTVTGSVAVGAGRLVAETTLTVQVQHVTEAGNLPAGAVDKFDTVSENDTLSADTVYPLDGVVMPQNVYPPDIQWTRGVTGDIFRITVQKPHAELVAYLYHDGTLKNHWLPSEAGWRSIAQTDPDDNATITVDRWVAASQQAITDEPVTVTFAKAAVTGSVYYWNIRTVGACAWWLFGTCVAWTTADTGRIVRIDDGTANAVDFMPFPNYGCTGCHSVSPSGRYIATDFGGGNNVAGTTLDLTTDLTTNPPTPIFPVTEQAWWFSTWSPDETRLAVTRNERGAYDPDPRGALDFVDPLTGENVAVTGTLPTNITHPAWSPDGTQIAFVDGAGSWGGENVLGDIAVIDVLGADTVGDVTVLHEGASLSGDTPGGNADSYPTWSPDSQLIAFAHGTGSRSDDQQGAIYVMKRDGTNVVRLEKASPGVNNFQPNFSPFEQGGYYWLSFLSKRSYGNSQAGSNNIQQVWIAAIKVDAEDGEDPSAVPYWLPGQRTGTRNISAFWAPRACRPDGEECSVDAECCGGDCLPDDDDVLVCTPPPPERCREYNETCTTTADCCEGEGLTCQGNVCTTILL